MIQNGFCESIFVKRWSKLLEIIEELGVSATHLDWTMVPYVRKSFFKHYLDGCKYVLNKDEEWIAENITSYVNKETCIDDDYGIDAAFWQQEPKAYQYALDMTEKETYQAVEGMYHNLKFWAI